MKKLEKLDSLHSHFLENDIAVVCDRTLSDLQSIWRSLGANEWREFIDRARKHPLREILHQDPFTCHSFQKPRGYPGDADLIDFMYRQRQPPQQTTEVGKKICSRLVESAPAAVSVRARAAHIAEAIDLLVEQVDQPRVMSVACGHIREAELSTAIRDGRVQRLVGLDADPRSIATIRQRLGEPPWLELHPADIVQLISRSVGGGDFDLVYSLGLYDYLPDPIAARLTAALFKRLVPGGKLVVANFMPHLPGIGYMETYMDWMLIYRTCDQLASLVEGIDSQNALVQTSVDMTGNIAYLEIVKA